ncbi:hypothetical protein GC584_06265 [Corynebacterium sp. zg912]|uniref:Uncharacterized protein n=1 Tax=Corynebacterium wankanglinii TaxID=2735136 RepID=A0A7V9A292_9CORY|nr:MULTISPECIES: hypothetical protein [Corynebacterium]MBA1837873.1 hypothetical protein [Corynebacterium wankanglinii]MCR5929023.1 hypothetical protein [Corynebacterium sp. zg912]
MGLDVAPDVEGFVEEPGELGWADVLGCSEVVGRFVVGSSDAPDVDGSVVTGSVVVTGAVVDGSVVG